MGHDAHFESSHRNVDHEKCGAASEQVTPRPARSMAKSGAARMEPLDHALGARLFVAFLRGGEFRLRIEGEIVGGREAVGLFHTFAARARFHAHAENQRLLDDEHQHGGQQKRGEATLRIEQRNVLILQGVRSELVLAVGGVAGALYFDARVHFERNVGGSGKNGFIIEHAAHIAIDAHVRLLHPRQIARKIFGDVNHAVNLASGHSDFGRFERRGANRNAHVGRSIEAGQKIARRRVARTVHHGHRHFVDRFRIVDQGIDQRIDDGHHHHKDDQCAITEYVAECVSESFVHVSDCLGLIGDALHHLAESSHKK